MASKRVTSHDVARRAGVSRATVSVVLNRSEAVALSPETRERVRRAAAELGYRPNSAGRMLASGSTETIGLIISDAAILPIDGFIPQVLHGIGHVNRERGLHVLLEGRDSSSGPNPYCIGSSRPDPTTVPSGRRTTWAMWNMAALSCGFST